MAKGQEQVASAASLCHELAALANASSPGGSEEGGLPSRLEAIATRLDGMQHRLFLRMVASLRYTEPCLAAASALQASLEAGAPPTDLEDGLKALEAAAATLEAKSMMQGGMIIT